MLATQRFIKKICFNIKRFLYLCKRNKGIYLVAFVEENIRNIESVRDCPNVTCKSRGQSCSELFLK